MKARYAIFSFFGFWGEGEREKFFLFSIGGGGPVIFHFIFQTFFVCSHSGDLP